MPTVFLSYDREDGDFAAVRHLRVGLRARRGTPSGYRAPEGDAAPAAPRGAPVSRLHAPPGPPVGGARRRDRAGGGGQADADSPRARRRAGDRREGRRGPRWARPRGARHRAPEPRADEPPRRPRGSGRGPRASRRGRTCGAARALAALGDPRAIPGVVAQRDWLRLQLGRTLAPFGLAALPALLDALRTHPAAGREYLAYALAELPGAATAAEVVPTLLALLDDTQAAMRVAAVRSLGQLGTAAAVPALAGRLRDADADVRAAAADALRHLGTPEALAALGTGARPA